MAFAMQRFRTFKTAAVTIQSFIRVSQARKLYFKMWTAAGVIISSWKANEERKRCHRLLEELKMKKAEAELIESRRRKAEAETRKAQTERKDAERRQAKADMKEAKRRQVEVERRKSEANMKDTERRRAEAGKRKVGDEMKEDERRQSEADRKKADEKFMVPAEPTSKYQDPSQPMKQTDESLLSSSLNNDSLHHLRAEIEQQVRKEYQDKYKNRILELAKANQGLVKEIFKRRHNETLLRKKLQTCAVELDRSHDGFVDAIEQLKHQNRRHIDEKDKKIVFLQNELKAARACNGVKESCDPELLISPHPTKKDLDDRLDMTTHLQEEFDTAVSSLMLLTAEANALPPVIGKHNKEEVLQSQGRFEQCVQLLDIVKTIFERQQQMLTNKNA
jgi:hypothetical protein